MLHDEVVSRLRHILMEGEIAPGARIPERDLCASLGISRTPLREALKVLAAEGIVVLLPNRGSRAAQLTQKDVNELFEVCEALEATAGELACPRITDAQLREIEVLQADMVGHYRARDLLSYYRCNRLIHESIVRAADNAVLTGFYEFDRGTHSAGALHHPDVSRTLGACDSGTRRNFERVAAPRCRRSGPYSPQPSSTQARGGRASGLRRSRRFLNSTAFYSKPGTGFSPAGFIGLRKPSFTNFSSDRRRPCRRPRRARQNN